MQTHPGAKTATFQNRKLIQKRENENVEEKKRERVFNMSLPRHQNPKMECFESRSHIMENNRLNI